MAMTAQTETDRGGRPEDAGRRPATGARGRWRSGRRYVLLVLTLRVASLVAVLAAWQVLVAVGLLSGKLFSDPVAVLRRVWETAAGAPTYGEVTIYSHLWHTVQAIAAGYAIGASAGVLAGYALGRSALLGGLFRPYVTAFVAIPKIALVPLLVLIFGIGMESKIANVVLLVFIMVLFNTFSGVLQVKREWVNLARVMGARRAEIAARIVLPAAMPSIMVGLRTGVSFAMIGAITAEFIASNEGLGWLIHQATAAYDPTGLFAGIVYLVVLTWGMGQLVHLLEKRTLRWMR
jgi:NitT/TauT family transport system permease protein